METASLLVQNVPDVPIDAIGPILPSETPLEPSIPPLKSTKKSPASKKTQKNPLQSHNRNTLCTRRKIRFAIRSSCSCTVTSLYKFWYRWSVRYFLSILTWEHMRGHYKKYKYLCCSKTTTFNDRKTIFIIEYLYNRN